MHDVPNNTKSLITPLSRLALDTICAHTIAQFNVVCDPLIERDLSNRAPG